MFEPKFLIVRGHNNAGEKIRPSNWTQRLAGAAAEFKRGRQIYDARVMPFDAGDGQVCLRVDRSIAEDRPDVLTTIQDFMRLNDIPEELTDADSAADDNAVA